MRVIPDFGHGSSKSGIRTFFGNAYKSDTGQISSRICRIWRMPVQLQDVQLITDNTNAELTCHVVYWQLYFVLPRRKSTKFIAIPQMLSKTGKQ